MFWMILHRVVFHLKHKLLKGNSSVTYWILNSITCCLRESLQLLSSQWTCACCPSWSWEFCGAASACGSSNPWKKTATISLAKGQLCFCLLLYPNRRRLKAVPGNVLTIKTPCVTYGSSNPTCKAAINRKQGKKTRSYSWSWKIGVMCSWLTAYMCLLNTEFWRSTVPIRRCEHNLLWPVEMQEPVCIATAKISTHSVMWNSLSGVFTWQMCFVACYRGVTF